MARSSAALLCAHAVARLACGTSAPTPADEFEQSSTWYSGTFTVDDGWSSHDTYPRFLADVDGDGNEDIVGFYSSGVHVSLSTGSAFSTSSDWYSDDFTVDEGGFYSQDALPRFLADVDGDGKADIVAFSGTTVRVSLSTGSAFATSSEWYSDDFTIYQGGWTSQDTYPRFLADVDGDGKADIVGFSSDDVRVSLSTGSSFATPTEWYSVGFTVNQGSWTSQDSYPRLLADVDGDGKADIVGFSSDTVEVSLSTGSSFASQSTWHSTSYCPNTGSWTSQDTVPRLLADVDGDGKADIVGFSTDDVFVSLSTGSLFASGSSWYTGFGASSGGYTSQDTYPRRLADVNGDGGADIVAFAGGSVEVSESAAPTTTPAPTPPPTPPPTLEPASTTAAPEPASTLTATVLPEGTDATTTNTVITATALLEGTDATTTNTISTATSTMEASSTRETATSMTTATATTTVTATSMVTATATTTVTATSVVTATAWATPSIQETLADIAKAEDTAAIQLIESNLSSITATIGGVEVTVAKASVNDAVDGLLKMTDVSAATGVDISLPTSLFAAFGVDSALVVASSLPAWAVPAGAAGTEVEGAISISLKSDDDGSTLSVTGLLDPILIDLPNVSGGFVCAYFDEDTLEWTSEGVATALGADGTLRCAASHLTVFGAIWKGFLSTLECSQASLLSAEAYGELWAGDWSDSVGSVLLYVGVFLFFAMLLTAHAFDIRDERAGRWGTKEFVVPEPVVTPEPVAERVVADVPMTSVVSDRTVTSGAPSLSRTLTKQSSRATVLTAARSHRDESVTKQPSGAPSLARTLTKQSSRATVLTAARSLKDESVAGAKESCTEVLQNALVEALSSLTQCVDGIRTAVEVFVVFAWDLLRGNVTLADVRKMLAERNATHQVCASLLMHSDDVHFLLSPEVQMELEAPAPGELDDEGFPLRTLAGSAAEVGGGEAKRRHDMLSEMVGRVQTTRQRALQGRRSWCHAARMAALSFVISCPIGAVLVHSVVMRRSMRALLLGCELLGAVMIATLFFAATGGALAKGSPEECSAECEDDDCLWQAMGKLIAVGVVSAFVASIPLAIIKLAHTRHFVRVPAEGDREWRLLLRRWRRRDAFIYVVGTLYSLFAINYVVLFFANVSSEDQLNLLSSAGVSFAQDLVFGPVLWSLAVVGAALCL